MASVSNPNAAVVAGNGLGPTTFVFAITTATITVANAIAAMTQTYGLTIVGVTGTAGGTEHVAAQGANQDDSNPAVGAESESGIALVATFTQNP